MVESKNVIVIEQANPQVIYVPSYDPVVVYGPAYYRIPRSTIRHGVTMPPAWQFRSVSAS